MAFVLRVLINGVAIWFATLVLPGLTIVGADTDLQHLGIILLIALVFGIVNAIVKPIVAFLSIPLYILTLGLFTIIVNALMLMLTAVDHGGDRAGVCGSPTSARPAGPRSSSRSSASCCRC